MSSDSCCTFTPISRKMTISLFTSSMLGMLDIVTGWEVSNTAQTICKASFLAPCGTSSPLSGLPPIISKAFCFIGVISFDKNKGDLSKDRPCLIGGINYFLFLFCLLV